MFMAADIVVKSVMAGLAFASLVTWTICFAKTLGILLAQRRLRRGLGIILTSSDLEAAGRADLKRNQDALAAACKLFAKGKTIPECIDKMNANKAADGPVALTSHL